MRNIRVALKEVLSRAFVAAGGVVKAFIDQSIVLEIVMSTAPLMGFSFPSEYATEYEIALDEPGSNTPTVSELDESQSAVVQTNAPLIETSIIYGIDPATGTVYGDTRVAVIETVALRCL